MKQIILFAIVAGIARVHAPSVAAQTGGEPPASTPSSAASAERPVSAMADWVHGAVCYEIFVRSFFDSDGDGVGDLEGVIRKLDYVNDGDPTTRGDLGARCIWLMPIAESPSYHGYDVSDYYRVDPDYGTNEDFRRLVDEAHRRGIAVLVDMVINHASRQHPHFRDAVLHVDSPYRDWFRWSATPGPDNEYGDNNWHRAPGRDEYYYGFFSPSMPDLNWETAAVRDEMVRASIFWLSDMGADGLRLDAVRHLMEDEAGVSTNVPRTHDMLREYAARLRQAVPNVYTVGEVFDGGEALLAYYPDQLDAYFAFEVSDGIFTAVRDGSAASLFDAVRRLQDAVRNDRWAPFLRNHDQVRTMTWLGGDVARARLAAELLLTQPGLPFVYYGEEIGMTGDKPDPRIRTPMQWELAPAAGFTTGEPWEAVQPDSLVANVEAMRGDPASLLNVYRELIHLRSQQPALGAAGVLVPLRSSHRDVAGYLRRYGTEVALVVANLSDTARTGVWLSSESSVLPAGGYEVETLYGGMPAADTARPLGIGGDGRMRGYGPLELLEPLRVYVFRLSPEAPRDPLVPESDPVG